jgi:hypothetical protein
MLGELILQHHGKAGGIRVLNAQLNKKEVTVISDGKVKGIAVSIVVTYWNIKRTYGTYYGEGQGIITPKERRNDKDDDQSLTVYECGIGKDSGQKTLWKGSAFYYAKNYESKENKLSALNYTIGVFETEVDNVSGKVIQRVWEWK